MNVKEQSLYFSLEKHVTMIHGGQCNGFLKRVLVQWHKLFLTSVLFIIKFYEYEFLVKRDKSFSCVFFKIKCNLKKGKIY